MPACWSISLTIRASRRWSRRGGSDALELAPAVPAHSRLPRHLLPDMLGWTVLSQLKQDATTRHIPVQIVSLDEDRQHGSRAAPSLTSPSPSNAGELEVALARMTCLRRGAAQAAADRRGQRRRADEHRRAPRARRPRDRGRRHRRAALAALRRAAFHCVVLDLRLPDMSGFEVLEALRDEPPLADVPVVVFTGRELTARRTRGCGSWRAASSSRASSRRSACSTRPRSSCIGSWAPPAGPQAGDAHRLHRSDEFLTGKPVLVVDDDVRNIFALSSVLERRGMTVSVRRPPARGDRDARRRAGPVDRPDGHHDAGDGRLPDHARDPREPGATGACRSSPSPPRR